MVQKVPLPGWTRVCWPRAAATAESSLLCFVELHHEEGCLPPETHDNSIDTHETLDPGGLCLHTHPVLCVDRGSIVDQVLNTVQVSGPHRHVKRGAVQLTTVEELRIVCEL